MKGPGRRAIALMVTVALAGACASATPSAQPSPQATEVPASPTPAAIEPTAIPTPTPIAVPTPGPVAPTPIADPTLEPGPSVALLAAQETCGQITNFAEWRGEFRGSCGDGDPLWATASTDGETLTVVATVDDGETFTESFYPYPDGLFDADDDFPTFAPGRVFLYADGDHFVAAVAHVSGGCCWVFVEMSFPAELAHPTGSSEAMIHEGTVVERRGIRGQASTSGGAEWAKGSYWYYLHAFEQVGDATWRIEMEPTDWTWAGGEFDTPSGQYWVNPVSAPEAVPFPADVATNLRVSGPSADITATFRSGVLEVGDGFSVTGPDLVRWRWIDGTWIEDDRQIGFEERADVIPRFLDTWNSQDWQAMQQVATAEVLLESQRQAGIAAPETATVADEGRCYNSDGCNGWIAYERAAGDDRPTLFWINVELVNDRWLVTGLQPDNV